MSLFDRNFLHHRLHRSLLISAAEGHKHSTGTDGGVKTLGKPAL